MKDRRKYIKMTAIGSAEDGFLTLNKNDEAGNYSVYSGFNYAIHTKDRDELIDAKYDRK